MHAELDGAAADSVDAERKVEQGTERGQSPNHPQPNGRGAGIPFLEQGMTGGEQAGQHVKPGGDVRPESVQDGVPVHRRKVSRKNGGAQAREFSGMVLIPGFKSC